MRHGLRGEVYRDDSHEWRWRAIARNNEKVGDSAEGYDSFHHAMKMCKRVCCLPSWRIKVIGKES